MYDHRSSRLFSQHSRDWRHNRYVYPVISRRSKGLSVGVNLNPDRVCNFDCIYCCVDRTNMPGRVEVNLDVLRRELDHMIEQVATGDIWSEPPFDQTPAALRRFNDIAFSGDGEPTSCPVFLQACQLAARSIDRPGIEHGKIIVITNASLLHQPRVRQALQFLNRHNGEIWAKLDAGTQDYYQLVERTSIPFKRVLDNILHCGRERPLVIQSLFMNIRGQPPPEAEIDAYIQRLRELNDAGCRIKLVQVYTIARETAEKYVTPLPDAPLDAIAQRVRGIGLCAEAYYAPAEPDAGTNLTPPAS